HAEKPEPPDDLAARTSPSPPQEQSAAERRPIHQFTDSLTHQLTDSPLPPMDPAERLAADYNGTGLTTGPHPMSLVRPTLPDAWRACDLPRARHGSYIRIAGNVICRQRPGTAKGFVFISLEDETGTSNAIITPPLFD